MIKLSEFNLKTLFYAVLLLNMTLFLSCNEKKNPVPNVSVDFYVDLTDPLYYDLQITGGYVYVTGGVSGILVYCISADEYRAYDRACPYDIDCGRVTVKEDGFFAVDSVCCGSEFSLFFDGAAEKGPAQFPLKQYACIYDKNTRVLHIKN